MKQLIYNGRKTLNNFVRRKGNNRKEGLGNLLTREVKFAPAFAIGGLVGGYLGMVQIICNRFYESGIVDLAYSNQFGERVLGNLIIMTSAPTHIMASLFVGGLGAGLLGVTGAMLDQGVAKLENSLVPTN